MLDFNSFGFDAIYCINLDRRPDRKAHAIREFEKAGITGYRFFPAVDGVAKQLKSPIKRLLPGMIGCYQSHTNVLLDSISKGYKRIAVFEDDLQVVPGFSQLVSFAFPMIPEDWHFAYLGYQEYGGFNSHLKQVNEFWVVPRAAWGTQALMYNTLFAQEKILSMLDKMEMQIDEQLSQIILPGSGLNYYAIFPDVVKQAFVEFGSDVQDLTTMNNGRH